MSRKRKNSPQRASIAPPSSANLPSIGPTALRRTRLFHLSLLILLSLALYAPTLRNDFVTDDKLQILQNSLVLEGKDLGRAFSADVWAFAHQGKENAKSGSNYYRPLQPLTYSAEYHLFGPNPLGWHLVNVLLNAAVVLLIYLLVASFGSPVLAFWTALFFALHPMHSEPVAWIAALPELQCALFLLLAMIFYHRSRSTISPVRPLLLSSFFFFAALFSKEPAILFPAILVSYEFLFPRSRPLVLRSVVLRLSPFLLALAIYLFARIYALGGFSPHTSMDRAKLSLVQLFFAIPAVFVRYVGKLLVPIHMNYFYAFPMPSTFSVWALAGFLVGLLLLAAFFYFRNTDPILSLALCWFAFTLAPALSLNSVAANFFTERYLYIPSVGFSILVASFILAIYSRVCASSWRWIPGAALATVFVFYVVQTERRVAIFHDNYSLLSETVHSSPNSYIVQGQLASAYYDRGDVDQALEHILLAVQYNPSYTLGHINAAWYLSDKKNYNAAVLQLKEAVRLYPEYLITWINLAKVYTLQHNWQLAAETYRHAATLDSGQSALFLQLASLAESNAKLEAAPATLHSADSSNSHDFAGWVRIGDAASQAGQRPSAADAYQHAAALHPDNANVVDKWGVALYRAGNPAQAVEVLQRGLQLNPDSSFVRQALAGALASLNRLGDSNVQLHKILQLDPTWQHADQVHLTLGANAERSGDPQTAIREYKQALALNPSLDYAIKRLAALR